MRVSEAHIDTFLEYVGELLVIGDMFNHLQKRLYAENISASMLTDFRRTTEHFSALSDNLQKSIMSIRKIPVRGLLQKVPRLVRDVAVTSHKEIAVETEGNEILIDKSLVDILDAPLTHMVRNAADHGVEPPDARVCANKPRQGRVVVSVQELPNNIVLSVRDDGAGLNLPAIRGKAEAMGLIKPGQPMGEQDIVNFIFQSGVSTATCVTDVSGRGVGMDVVKRTTEQMGGSIHVRTEAGKGSTFEVVLPTKVTTQIIQGFLVEVGDHDFLLPLERVYETAQLNDDDRGRVCGKAECILRHGKVLSVLPLAELLGLDPIQPRDAIHTVVTVTSGRDAFLLPVDGVLGVRQVVFRPIQGLQKDSDAISGAALLGDGSVALILDVDKLYAEYKQGRRSMA